VNACSKFVHDFSPGAVHLKDGRQTTVSENKPRLAVLPFR
jgi:hypothetical protein